MSIVIPNPAHVAKVREARLTAEQQAAKAKRDARRRAPRLAYSTVTGDTAKTVTNAEPKAEVKVTKTALRKLPREERIALHDERMAAAKKA